MSKCTDEERREDAAVERLMVCADSGALKSPVERVAETM